LYWQYSLADIRVKLKLHLGQQQALIMQQYDTMALLLNQAFGNGGGAQTSKSPTTTERSAGTLDEMKAAFAGIF
jgi:hypothetical protein